MVKITINELLDSVPMGGFIIAYAPVAKVVQEVNSRNMERRGEWYSVSTLIDNREQLVVVIYRREQWNIADATLLLQEQHRWQHIDNVWRA